MSFTLMTSWMLYPSPRTGTWRTPGPLIVSNTPLNGVSVLQATISEKSKSAAVFLIASVSLYDTALRHHACELAVIVQDHQDA